MADRPYVCAKCLHPYTRKPYFDEHFNNARAKGGGANPCYKSKVRLFGRSVDEAKSMGKTPCISETLNFSAATGSKRQAKDTDPVFAPAKRLSIADKAESCLDQDTDSVIQCTETIITDE